MNQTQLPDRPATKAPRAERELLDAQLEQLRAQGKQVSRAIGVAKQSGEDIRELLEQRKRLSQQEQDLSQAMVASSKPHEQATRQPTKTNSPPPVPSDRQELGPVTVARLAEEDTPAWDHFVSQQPQATSYHLSGWQTVLHKSFGHTSHHLVAKRAGHVVGALPLVQLNSALFGNFLVSLPFLNYGGVLAQDGEVHTKLLEQAVTVARDLACSHLELRETAPSATWPMRTDKVSMWLPLPATKEALWAQIGSKLRAQIKKGLGQGLTFDMGGVELLDDFYRVFSTNMRDLGTPVYAKRFFEIVLKEAPGQPELVLGRDAQGRPVAGALVLRHGARMEVPWASTLRRANGLNANMALYWTMLSHACEAGCSAFDFGRSTVDANTHRFKKQWGASAVPLYWHYWMADGTAIPQINPGNPKYRMAIAAWKRLPVVVANRLGPYISRTLP
ncbi:MAG: FemAB family XrtA/PEP-CTERM system-associated protein [Acidovorax sp.]|uniref:FemAB family XrtA/PEP-CTERM system-associated protein n=1 Tax=Acidovorax sp. TaxID=1872122 RepID=UPI003919A515